MIRAVLFDLDGVVRHFDPAQVTEIERRHELHPGALGEAVFAAPDIIEVTTGRISRAEWIRRIGTRLGHHDAAREWGRQPSSLDDEVVRLAVELRTLGLRTAILTNGTSTIAQEASDLRLDRWFDTVFNSADIGYAKPDPRAFEHVLGQLGLPAQQVFFTDDTASKLHGATALGMPVHRFTAAAALRSALLEAGLPLRRR